MTTNKIEFTKENLTNVIEQCKDYAEHCSISPMERQEYLDDIEEHPNDWGIIFTSVFHDAIGEIDTLDDNAIYVKEEY